MDLSKAFDSVCHKKLINYLDKIGIKHKALNLFKSYLEHRTHKVKIDNIISSSKTLSLGVSTVLSPLLYIIYVTGLSNLQINGNLYSYADDTALLVSDNIWVNILVTKKTEDSLKKIVTWFSNNNLTLNNNKTVFLTFSNTSRTTHNVPTLKIHAPTCNLYIQCNCSHINRTDYTKYLGVIFDQHLRWNLHTTELNLKLRKLYTFYTMAKQFLNTHWLKNTYFALYLNQ